jgi:hypothetical protein
MTKAAYTTGISQKSAASPFTLLENPCINMTYEQKIPTAHNAV